MNRAALAAFLLLLASPAGATGFTDATDDLGPRDHGYVTVEGMLRARGGLFYNLDLDRGLDPAGRALFPVSSRNPAAQTLSAGDARIRADLSAFAPGGSLAAKARVDVFDDVALGGAPAGMPGAGAPARDSLVHVKRAYAEWLTPVGLLTAGRMGSSWGLGLVANGGDGEDAGFGDASDRAAFITPVAGLLWAVAWDLDSISWTTPRDARAVFEKTDPAQTVTFAVLSWRGIDARNRRASAGKTTFEWGALVSHRWQDRDIIGTRSIPRGYTADAGDGWARLTHRGLRVEFEGAIAEATVRQASTVPGVLLHQTIRSRQTGWALESDLEIASRFSAGVDAGYASGDPAPGFGVNATGTVAPRTGSLDGPQASLPGDDRVDNFRFHPEYRIDRILFHELIGTVTDAVYARPHARAIVLHRSSGDLVASTAVIASRAIYASSTPGGKTPLGVEIDPTLAWESPRGFSAALEHAVLFPMAGLDNPAAGMTAKPAQLFRLRVLWRFM